MINIEDTVFLFIDIQEKLVNMLKNKDEIVENNEILVKTASVLKLPVIATEQYPKGLGKTVFSIQKYLKSENVFEKTSFSAVANPQLIAKLSDYNPKNIVITGIESHICVYQTALELLNNGYNVYIVKNAVSSRNSKDYKTALQLLRDFGARLTCVETVVFELLKSSKHPNFKEIQALIK